MASRRVLIADDDENVLEILELYLKKDGFEVIKAGDGQEALELFKAHQPDLLVLDIMMPKQDGLETARKVREGSKVPIILLTAKAEEVDKIIGLELGADDYVTKPFSPREVVARIKAVLRRMGDSDKPEKTALEYPFLTVDIENYTIKVAGQPVACTPKEIELLWHLMKRPGRVFSREELLEAIWGYDYFGDTRTVDTHIKRLRKKLDMKEDFPWDIVTVWGVGYKFEVVG